MKLFSDFRFRVAFRVILIGLIMSMFIYIINHPNMIFAAILTGFIIGGQLIELYSFTSQTNRKLTRFLESVKYSDFISGFTADNKLGTTFRELNVQFNEVMEAFRRARSEKEEHWQYLNTVVQQVRTGILSFDPEGNIQLINANAKKSRRRINSIRRNDLLKYRSAHLSSGCNTALPCDTHHANLLAPNNPPQIRSDNPSAFSPCSPDPSVPTLYEFRRRYRQC